MGSCPEMVNVCWQCGDIGISEALVHCINCRSAARHRYCLEEVPEDFAAEINWLCEDCGSNSPSSVSKAKFPTPTSPGMFDHVSGMPRIGPTNPCEEIGSANGRLVNSKDQLPASSVIIGLSVNPDNRISHDLKKRTLSCAINGALDTISSSSVFKTNDDGIEEPGNEKSKRERLMLSDKDKSDNERLVNSQDQHPVSNVIIGSSLDDRFSHDLKKRTLSCAINGALDTISSSSGFKPNDDGIEELGNGKSKRERLMLSDKDKLDNERLVNSHDQHPVSNVIIGSSVNLDDRFSHDLKKKTLSCAINGALDTISSSSGFKLNDDGIEEPGNEKSKRERLMLSDKDKSDNERLVNSQDQHPVSNVIIGSSVNPDDRFSHDLKKKTLSCAINGALDTISSSSGFKLNDDGIEDLGNGDSKKERLMLSGKDKLDNSQPLVEAQGTNIQFAAKRLPDTSGESSDRLVIGGTSNCDIGELGKSSVRFRLKEEQTDEYEKERSKRRGLILPCKDEFNRFHPLVNGEGTNFSLAVKRIPDTTHKFHAVGSFACHKREEEEEAEQYEKRELKSRRLILQTNNFHPLIDSQGTSISFVVKKTRTSSFRANALGAVGSSACFEFKGGQIEEQNEKSMIRMVIPGINQLDDIHPPIEGQCSSVKFEVKRLSGTSIGESDKQGIGSASSSGIAALGVVRSSSCSGTEDGEIKAHSKKGKKRRTRSSRKRWIPPVKGEGDNFHSAIFCKDNNGSVVAKSTPVEASDKQIMRVKTGDTLGAIRSSSICFELKNGEIDRFSKDQSESRDLILPIEDELSGLHPVIDRRGTNMKFAAKMLPGSSDEPSDKLTIRWVDTDAQIKPPCQPASPSSPVGPHVWRGCFNINKSEKLPRLVSWPNSFKVSSPTDESVALYFFPESDRVETVNDELVDDIINNDLVLRFEFDEVELLVFSSFVLPHEHQRFFGKYYPWGVFKPNSAKICSLPAVSHTGYRAGETLKPVRRGEVEDRGGGKSKYSAKEINDFTLRRSLIQPGEVKLMVTAVSTDASEEEGKLQALHRKPSRHVELLWHREEQLGGCEKKLGLERSKNHTLELKEVTEEI